MPTISGVVSNSSTITVADDGELLIGNGSVGSGATLVGGGVVTFGSATATAPNDTGAILTNVDNTLEAQGGSVSGANQNSFNVLLVNEQEGIVEADGNNAGSGDLYIHSDVTNSGTLAAVTGGALYIIGATIDATSGGIIESSGAGSNIYLNSNSSSVNTIIEGGTLETPGGGSIVANNAVLDGSGSNTVTNAGTLTDNGTLAIEGVIDNSGTIAVVAGNYFEIGGTDDTTGGTLEGGGVITLGNSNEIVAAVSGAVLTNVDNTLEAQGGSVSGANQNSFNVLLVNEQQGIVEADGNNAGSGDLYIHSDVTNSGTLAAVTGGALYIIGATINATSGGIIESTGAGSNIYLNSNSSSINTIIEGGTLETPGGGSIVANNAVLDGSGGNTVTNAGTLTDNGTLAIEGVIDNSGTIAVVAGNYFEIGGTDDTTGGTLEGGGVITLGNSNEIVAAVSGAVLTNVDNTLEAQGGSVSGANQNSFNVLLVNEQQGIVEADGNNAGSGDLYIHSDVTNSGTLGAVNGGVLNLKAAVDNTGIVAANGGVVNVDAGLSGSGFIDILGGGQANLNVATGENTEFNGSGGTLQITDTTDYTGTLHNFSVGDTVDLPNLQISSPMGNPPDYNGYPDHGAWTGYQYEAPYLVAAYSGSGDIGTVSIEQFNDYTIYDQNNNIVGDGGYVYDGTLFTINVAGTYSSDSFNVFAASGGGYDITTSEMSPCYCRDTLILTDHGEMPVQALRIGDRLVTHAGGLRPIKWIGRRSYAGRFAARNRDVLPVRIRAGALADGVPRRDLFISPLHAMFLDGLLIPASALLNGTSITQLEAVDQVEYIHLELDTHDVILAEGAPSETFLDDDSRDMFHNAEEYRALYPDATLTAQRYCAPRVEDGEALEAVRERLAARVPPARPRADHRLNLGQAAS